MHIVCSHSDIAEWPGRYEAQAGQPPYLLCNQPACVVVTCQTKQEAALPRRLHDAGFQVLVDVQHLSHIKAFVVPLGPVRWAGSIKFQQQLVGFESDSTDGAPSGIAVGPPKSATPPVAERRRVFLARGAVAGR